MDTEESFPGVKVRQSSCNSSESQFWHKPGAGTKEVVNAKTKKKSALFFLEETHQGMKSSKLLNGGFLRNPSNFGKATFSLFFSYNKVWGRKGQTVISDDEKMFQNV